MTHSLKGENIDQNCVSFPGILQREQEQSVVYGSIDSGKNVASQEKFMELVRHNIIKLWGVTLLPSLAPGCSTIGATLPEPSEAASCPLTLFNCLYVVFISHFFYLF